MNYRKTLIATLLVAAIASGSISAQQGTPIPPLEELPQRAIDTLNTKDENVKIVIYTNNTWGYLYTEPDSLNHDIYRDHWTNSQIFAYSKIQLKDLPQVIELNLIEKYEDFHAPIVGRVFSKYGRRGKRNHNGVDIPLTVGEPIYATFDGKVRYAQYNSGGFGNLVIIRHENGLETWYGHLSRCNVAPNDYVKAGMVIGFGGTTGRSRGPHLHFEMRYCDQTFDPEHLIEFESGDLRYQTFALKKSFFNINSRASETLEEDENYEQVLLAVNSPDGELTSEDILKNIAAAEKKTTAEPKKSEKPKTDPLYHTVKKGEYLGKIAKQYGTTVKKLCQLNNISEDAVIRDGRKLRVR